MSAAQDSTSYRDMTPMVIEVAQNVQDTLRRSPIWERMTDGSLPFAGRASYLEQHWEGLRALLAAVEAVDHPGLAEMREQIKLTTEKMGEALDRSHATARWREHHVTMPSMLECRRRIAEMQEAGNVISLAAHCVVRLAAVGACPVTGSHGGISIPPITVVYTDEQEELFAEELSAALIMLLSHGADVCRAYQGQKRAQTCAVTAAMIRSALR